MIINIFGSTGVIGKKTLELIDLNFPQIKVNLLCAKSNITLLKKQIKKHIDSKLLHLDGDTIRITSDGKFLSDKIASDLFKL